MSMKGKLGMYMAMAMAMGGMGMDMPKSASPRPQPRKLSHEEEEEFLEKATEKFLLDLQKHNEERMKNFPKWKVWEVNGCSIIACNKKNAIRDLGFLLSNNFISIK